MTNEGEEYVDLDAVFDGPTVVQETPEGVPLPPFPVNDLILCQSCLTEAGALVGLGDVDKEREELESLRAEVLELRKLRIEAERRLDAVESAFEGRAKRTSKKAVAPRKTRSSASKALVDDAA
jgi:hypothetical protein